MIQNWNFDHKMSAIYNKSKVTNTQWSINQCNEKLYFPDQPHNFPGLLQTFPYLWSFFRSFKAWKISTYKFHDFPNFSRICTDPVITWQIWIDWRWTAGIKTAASLPSGIRWWVKKGWFSLVARCSGCVTVPLVPKGFLLEQVEDKNWEETGWPGSHGNQSLVVLPT